MPELYLIFLFLSFLSFVGIKLFAVFKLSKNKTTTATVDIKDITVIIPFRNEENNLPQLLDSFLFQEILPSNIYFINDHSTDFSVQILEEFIKRNKVGELFFLPEGKFGKKEALVLGVDNTETKYILTLDADVVLNKKYMNSLSETSVSQLSSFPVIMVGEDFWGKFAATEYMFFNAFNFLISPIYPVSVSGANLLFDTNSVNYRKQLKNHNNLLSGDDFFLLKEFRKKRKSILISNKYDLCVFTSAPDNFQSYLNQRVRWVGKGKKEIKLGEILVGVFTFIYTIGGFFILLLTFFSGNILLTMGFFSLRLLLDSFIYNNYMSSSRIIKTLVTSIIFQLFYPLLMLLVLFSSLFYQPKWKERETKTK